MKKLHKCNLNFDPTWEYVVDILDKVNILSIELLNTLNFKNGHFFTLLPSNANFENIYDFKGGLVLPQLPEQEQIVNGHKSTYSWIPDINNELSHLMLKEMAKKPQLSCVIDDVLGSPKDKYYTLISDNFSFFYEEQVYFFIKKDNISLEVIAKCLKASNSFWHSLCVFTTADLMNVNKIISLEKIKEICLNIQLFMVEAYDGEGYVFWEKNFTDRNEGFFKQT